MFRMKNGISEASTQEGMCALAGGYYAGLLGVPVHRQHTHSLPALRLPVVDTTTLEAPLTETLIWNMIKET